MSDLGVELETLESIEVRPVRDIPVATLKRGLSRTLFK